MRDLKTLSDRLANQQKSRQMLEERLKRLASKPKKAIVREKPAPIDETPTMTAPPSDEQPVDDAWKHVRIQPDSPRAFSAAISGAPLRLQPWARSLTNIVLEAASSGSVHLCFVWPAEFEPIALVHSLINIERHFAKDMLGIRTLLYPGTHSTRLPLNSIQISRTSLVGLYRSMLTTEGGSAKFKSETTSKAFESVLEALNTIEMWGKNAPDPNLGALSPVFVFDHGKGEWESEAKVQLDKELRKISKRSNRRDIRDQISSDWTDARNAPGAMFVLHSATSRKDWKEALSSKAMTGTHRPDLLLLDATSSATQKSFGSVQRIPEFLKLAFENGCRMCGSVVITDDPKTFFSMRARFSELRIVFASRVLAAEGEEAILAADSQPEGWMPAQRTLSNFYASIVDRDASQVALALQRIANESGSEGEPPHDSAMAACLFVLRLSNLPAGFADLSGLDDADTDYRRSQNSWVNIKIALQSSLAAGAFNRKRDELERAVSRAENLIDDWSDATPMATRLLSEVRKYAVDSRSGLSIVLPSTHYIELARRFLKRKLGLAWEVADQRTQWIALSAVKSALATRAQASHFVFVGINRTVLRLLLTHQDVPHGTTILIAYRQADATLKTLEGLRELDELKPYRGRIGLLMQELKRRLDEVPNPLLIGKLGEINLTFGFNDSEGAGQSDEQSLFKFDLENGHRVYSSGWMYRYDTEVPPYFRRVAASTIDTGDLVFEMSDELKSDLEDELHVGSSGSVSVLYPERVLLKLYHDEVQSRCSRIFGMKKRSMLAREILASMIQIDPRVRDCRPGRIYYWLALGSEGDTRPHAPKDGKYFKVFCKALEIDDEQTARHWNFIRNARRLNQNLGRELAARYAEILFQPESAATYRKLSEATITRLQEMAVRCVFRVERIVPPESSKTT